MSALAQATTVTFVGGKPEKMRIDKVLSEREFFIDNLLVRNHFIIVMIRWTDLAPCEFESASTRYMQLPWFLQGYLAHKKTPPRRTLQ